MLNTPVVLLIFNRAEQTRMVLEAIAQVQPKKLFVIADGPRTPEEAAVCEETRAVIDGVDWDCDVVKNYSEVNLGCRQRSATGFDWVFSQVEDAIFLDDDCLADPSFFYFCQEMLDYYRTDTRVMMITGSNYLGSWKADKQSYHFSYFGSSWAWASWRRAWQHYDVSMSAWGDPDVRERVRDVLGGGECADIQATRFDNLYNDPANRHSWDLPWTCSRLAQSGLSVVPCVNLVSNIGCFGESTIPPDWPTANLPRSSISFPLTHPTAVGVDRLYDLRHIRRAVGRDDQTGEYLFGPKPPPRDTSMSANARRIARRVVPAAVRRSLGAGR